MTEAIEMNTNHGQYPFDEYSIPSFLSNAAMVADLDWEDCDPTDYDTDHWPEALKLSLMYTAQMYWFPGSSDETSSWSTTENGISAATEMFKDYPGLLIAVTGDDTQLIESWNRFQSDSQAGPDSQQKSR